MQTELPIEPPHPESKYIYSRIIAGLGAVGVALQNYPAVVLFATDLTKGIITSSQWLYRGIQIGAVVTGGLCSGMVNYWMNVELLDGFINRMTSDQDYQYKKLSAWQKLQYFGGIFVFLVTGLLFGLMAFTFTMGGPLAVLSIAAGVFVACIMTIQEVETWLKSYDEKDAVIEEPLTNQQYIGKCMGHIIAAGNVLALSLLFTLGIAQGLIALQVAALPALIIGLAIAFTFGAFTEYYFYNFYLADFCKNFTDNWAKMLAVPHAWFGFLCVSTNAFVNAALTYVGVELLMGLLFLTLNIAIPSLALITVIAATSAIFAGGASFILGLDFWVEQNKVKTPTPVASVVNDNASIAKKRMGLFPANENSITQTPKEEQKTVCAA